MSKITLWTLEDEADEPEWFGKVVGGGTMTYAPLRSRLEENETLEWGFEFWDVEDKRRMRKKLEGLNDVSANVYVIRIEGGGTDSNKRRRVIDGSHVVDPVEAYSTENFLGDDNVGLQPLDPIPSVEAEGNVESSKACDEKLKSTLISNAIMDRYLERAKRLRADLKRTAQSDHDWWLKSFDLNGSGVVKLWCGECRKDCGGGSGEHTKASIDNLFNNFKNSHLVSASHVKNFCAAKNVNFQDYPQSVMKNGKALILTPADYRRMIDEGVQIVSSVNETLSEGQKPLTIVGNLSATDTRCYWFKVKCQYCRELMVLCPLKKTLHANLMNHLNGPKHLKAVEDAVNATKQPARTGRRGRPTCSSTTSTHSNQLDLHSWFTGSSQHNEEGKCGPLDMESLQSFMCFGFRGPNVEYGGLSYVVMAVLQDPHAGVKWYSEPYLHASVQVGDKRVGIAGVFRNRACNRISLSREPFPNLTCSMCAQIPREDDFRMRVRREDRAVVKRGCRTTGRGIRLGYLTMAEVSQQAREVTMKHRLQKLHYWHACSRIVQLKAKRPTQVESAKNASADGNLIKLCNNILTAHRTGAFGGKPGLWDFMKDVAANLNRDSRGNRYSDNTKCFAQAMRVYGGETYVSSILFEFCWSKL